MADPQLSGLARAHVKEMLGVESLEEAATWPDEMRSAPEKFWQKTATPWHYVTLNGIVYDHAPSEGDALQALNRFRTTLQDPERQPGRQAACAALHRSSRRRPPSAFARWQMLRQGRQRGEGKWFGRPTQPARSVGFRAGRRRAASFTELAAKLERHTSDADVMDWWDINPRDWISESGQIRETVYPPPATSLQGQPKAKSPPELSYGYVYKFTPLMEQRLKQAGVRLAAYLNDVYSKPPAASAKTGSTDVPQIFCHRCGVPCSGLHDRSFPSATASGASRSPDPRHQRLPRKPRTVG